MSYQPQPEIECPECHGEGWLECSAGCPGDDPSCRTCAGQPQRCECFDGRIPQPAFCHECLPHDEAICWEEHDVFSVAVLDRAIADGRLVLSECKPRLCAPCSAALIGEAGGAW